VNKNLTIREYEESNLKEEIVQAILDLFVLSEIHHIDLPEAITEKMEKMAKNGNHQFRHSGSITIQRSIFG